MRRNSSTRKLYLSGSNMTRKVCFWKCNTANKWSGQWYKLTKHTKKALPSCQVFWLRLKISIYPSLLLYLRTNELSIIYGLSFYLSRIIRLFRLSEWNMKCLLLTREEEIWPYLLQALSWKLFEIDWNYLPNFIIQ